MNSVQNVPLIDPKNIFLPPLHIKLGLMIFFVKAMGKTKIKRISVPSSKLPLKLFSMDIVFTI